MIKFPQFQCGEGWWGIINEAIDEIIKVIGDNDITIQQIKEKFGGLVIYCFDADDAVKEIIAKAEDKAAVTCEITGEPGLLCRKEGGWLKTLCVEKAKELGFEIVVENPIKKI